MHDDAVDLAHVVNAHDVAVRHLPRQQQFLLERSLDVARSRISRDLRAHDLHGHHHASSQPGDQHWRPCRRCRAAARDVAGLNCWPTWSGPSAARMAAVSLRRRLVSPRIAERVRVGRLKSGRGGSSAGRRAVDRQRNAFAVAGRRLLGDRGFVGVERGGGTYRVASSAAQASASPSR
jgi:hypothetical protein